MPHGQVVDECKGTLFIHTPLFPFCLSVVILRSEDYARAGRRPDFSSRCFVLFQSAHPAREMTKSRVPMVISGWGMLFRNPRVVSSSWRMAEMGSNTFNYVPHHFFFASVYSFQNRNSLVTKCQWRCSIRRTIAPKRRLSCTTTFSGPGSIRPLPTCWPWYVCLFIMSRIPPSILIIVSYFLWKDLANGSG